MKHKTTTFQQRLANQIAKRRDSQEGITLLESLVSIIVLTIAISTVTPPIFLAVATRVQNRKAEQAMNLAQKYVDRVQGLVREGNYGPSGPNALPGQNPNQANPELVPPPGGLFPNVLDSPSSNCNNFNNFTTTNMPAWNQALQVDVDGDCQPDFFVQIFRSSLQQQNNNGQVVAFPIGVRVYAWAAQGNFGNLCNPSTNNNIQQCPNNLNNNPGRLEASLGPTEGLGAQRIQPLAVTYANVVYSENAGSLQWYRNNLQNLPANLFD